MILAVLLAAFPGQGDTTYNNPVNAPQNLNLAYEKPYYQYTDEVTYDDILDEALFNCPNAKFENVDEQLLLKLIKIEKSFNPPPEMRGMLLAAACMESGYNPNAKGDRKFSKTKKIPMAIGILQQWKIYEKMYPGMNRTNPESAATTWMQHIVAQLPKVKKQCRYKTQKRNWLAAWVTGIRYKKAGGRCKEVPKHYRLLTRWHKNIKQTKIEIKKCLASDECGC